MHKLIIHSAYTYVQRKAPQSTAERTPCPERTPNAERTFHSSPDFSSGPSRLPCLARAYSRVTLTKFSTRARACCSPLHRLSPAPRLGSRGLCRARLHARPARGSRPAWVDSETWSLVASDVDPLSPLWSDLGETGAHCRCDWNG
ncbi:hypothetical protein L202_03426 [Cryptococcus amylolentus CBS 6039]|uniref:Uncharacterized protein n=1 Tax=Cryptococcus amylolentus CBS 6039 TaxID=1295533 RepID=A0A1E3HSW4_9TREE|nr:hypothetical protein L202_03426 [Cryptococcus amylolentus CBS 6039]ODN79448.1 hypothetical protein L202_03426 [Cryptococcus amylolentus CBS 6039]